MSAAKTKKVDGKAPKAAPQPKESAPRYIDAPNKPDPATVAQVEV